jgi:multiple RNA-binding domain-containing protein 1
LCIVSLASCADSGTGTEADVAESGRLFLRNLSYAVSEEDLTNLFGKFGPLAEVHVPLEKVSTQFSLVCLLFCQLAIR